MPTDPTFSRLIDLLLRGAKNAGLELSRGSAEKLARSMRECMAEDNTHLVYQTEFDKELAKLEGTL